jgi:hypothetical protein
MKRRLQEALPGRLLFRAGACVQTDERTLLRAWQDIGINCGVSGERHPAGRMRTASIDAKN